MFYHRTKHCSLKCVGWSTSSDSSWLGTRPHPRRLQPTLLWSQRLTHYSSVHPAGLLISLSRLFFLGGIHIWVHLRPRSHSTTFRTTANARFLNFQGLEIRSIWIRDHPHVNQYRGACSNALYVGVNGFNKYWVLRDYCTSKSASVPILCHALRAGDEFENCAS